VNELDHVTTTRLAYDAVADSYAQMVGTEVSAAIEAPLDRAMLAAFVESVTGSGAAGRPVADVGCGPGRVAAYLAAHGLDVVGVDMSPAMLAVARAAHPGIRFEEGLLTELPVPDRSLAGAVSWGSIIHTPPEHLGDVCTELARALAPGGELLVAFQAGSGEGVHRSQAYGTAVRLTSYRHAPDEVARQLAAAGLPVHARAVREPALSYESTPLALLVAKAPSDPAAE
jgi:ubiquinone/menaquinone biosynthesis C-methylase UbiE